MTANVGVTAAKTGRKQRNSKAKSERATGGPKRPLNSWMAFRKYYNASLAPNTQKSISKVLRVWWRADPFEAKWAMLAKAYSILRGSREKEYVPLDEFFTICAPLIGVIPPDEYPQVMGWHLFTAMTGVEDTTPRLIRLFTPSLNNFPEKYTTTSLSVHNLVGHCCKVSYAGPGSDGASKISASSSLIMAAQPTVTDAANSHTADREPDSAMPLLIPSQVALNPALFAAPSEPPAGRIILSNATTAIDGPGGIYSYNTTFSPTSHFDISFKPSIFEEGKSWATLDVAVGGIDWDAFVNEDGIV